MKPIKFDEANKNLLKPQNMTDEECSSLWVFTDGEQCISCWEMTFKQRLSALIHGKVWLSVLSGPTQPPVWVDCCNTVFKRSDNNARLPHCYCDECPAGANGGCAIKTENIIDLIYRLQADKEYYKKNRDKYQDNVMLLSKQCDELQAENERLKKLIDVRHKVFETKCEELETAKAEAYKEFAEKVDEILKRYANLHKNADKARHSTEEYADGTPMEMVSVWEVLSLKKWEMCDYETMNTLEDNIEIIAKERLLTELEKDLRLLKKEMAGEDNERTT